MKTKKKIMSDWIEIGKKQAIDFMNNNVAFMEVLITCVVPIKLMLLCYRSLVIKKAIKELESLPVNQKNTIWEQAKEFSNGRLNKDQLIDLCRSLYTLEYLLNL